MMSRSSFRSKPLALVVRAVTASAALLAITGVGVVLGGLYAGYRPVVLQTGSMSPAAPAGSLIIAAPRTADSIAVGDVVIMRRDGVPTVTHRVVEIEPSPRGRIAITQGDANESPDATPYALEGEQLVGRWVGPAWGFRFQRAFGPGPVMAVLLAALVVVVFQTIRWIWRPRRSPQSEVREVAATSGDPGSTAGTAMAPSTPSEATQVPATRRRSRRRWPVAGLVPLTLFTSAGVAWAMFDSTDAVPANVLGTADCFDAQLGGVQSGETVHAVDGVVTVPISPVDPAASFVMSSVRSASDEPADSTVQIALRGDGGAVELTRRTDAGAPPTVVVAWSVVSYTCGVAVQHGTAAGDGTGQLDLAIGTIDPTTSFTLVTSAAEGTATDFGDDDLYVADLASSTSLRITTGGSFDPGRTFAWQVVTFVDGGDIDVQTVTGSLGSGDASTSIALAPAVDPGSTFLLTGITTTATGPAVGDRMVRTRLDDGANVVIDRSVTGPGVDVTVQVVTLRDGTTVRHGQVDFSAGQAYREVPAAAVDPSRTTVVSTVAVPGLQAGGLTDHAAADVAGEASATFAMVDGVTVAIERASFASPASFAWQAIEWAGPGWWDNSYPFRQRIDVETTTEAAPGGYSVPVTFDHAALVQSGLSLADGSDLRLLRWDGSAWLELDRVLADGASWNAAATTVWFQTTEPIAGAGRDTYWLYFGNGAPGPPAADPEGVFPLVEGFESGMGDFEDRTAGTGWYRADPWTGRLALTVSGAAVPATVTDHQLMVDLTSAAVAAGALADGSDLRFTAADGTTPLAHEIEHWDAGAGRLLAWVDVPSLPSGSDTVLHLYWGAPDAPDQQDLRSVWDTGLGGVWHLHRDPSGRAPHFDDRSPAERDGLSAGSMTGADSVAGVIGSAVDFDGVDDRAELGRVPVGASGSFTLEAWIRADATAAPMTVVSSGTPAGPLAELRVDPIDATSGELRAEIRVGGSPVIATGPAPVAVGAWHHVALIHDGTSLTAVVDGTAGSPVATAAAVDQDPTATLTIGGRTGGVSPFDGPIDEVRLAEVARTTDRLAVQFANATDPGFLTVGPAEAGSWFDGGDWSFRRPITVDAALLSGLPSGSTPAQADVAFPLQLIDTDLAAGAEPDAADLVVTGADGLTRLDHVVERWVSGTGELVLWVRVPTIDPAAATRLFLYYGNPTAVDQADPAAVFGPDADLVSASTT